MRSGLLRTKFLAGRRTPTETWLKVVYGHTKCRLQSSSYGSASETSVTYEYQYVLPPKLFLYFHRLSSSCNPPPRCKREQPRCRPHSQAATTCNVAAPFVLPSSLLPAK